MSSIRLKEPDSCKFTLIKNTFIDNYMINANGEYVKIYLYLLRCFSDPEKSSSLTISAFADTFDCTEKDILRGLKYWENAGLLTLTFSQECLTEIALAEPAAQMSKSAPDTPAEKELSASRMSSLLDNRELKQLMTIAQTYLGKMLNQTEVDTLIFFYDNLGFSADLIEYLLEYCVTNLHKSFRYIEKVAIAWHEAGIVSRSQAKEYVSSYSNTYFSILKAFGITGRSPAQTEKDFIDKWQNVYGFQQDIILEACTRTINTIHQPSFKYADSILSRWKEKGVSTLSDLASIDQAHEKRRQVNQENAASQPVKKTAFNNFPERDYDFDALEKALLQRN